MTPLAICRSKSATNRNRIGRFMGFFTDKETGEQFATLRFNESTIRNYKTNNVEFIKLSQILQKLEAIEQDKKSLQSKVSDLSGSLAKFLIKKSKSCKKRK